MVNQLSNRRLKQRIGDLLRGENLESATEAIHQFSPRRTVNPLFSLLLDKDELIRWRAVTAMGAVVACLAESHLESARVVLRRMLWMLNDESGGIGWGIPESMGEIMARSDPLSREYACMLISYCKEDGNYLEHPILQRGVVWGLGRLIHARPTFAAGCGDLLLPYLKSPDPVLRGTAAWASGVFPGESIQTVLKELAQDPAPMRIYIDKKLRDCTVGELARNALRQCY